MASSMNKWTERVLFLIIVLVLFALYFVTYSHADSLPSPCAKEEPYEICIIMLQRDQAQNDLARVAGEQKREEIQATAKEEYWKNYVNGIEIQVQNQQKYWEDYLKGMEVQRQSTEQNAKVNSAWAASAARRH